MIPVECACGRTLRLKDEMAGKRVRCPTCSETVKVPAAEPHDGFLDDIEDESSEELPLPQARSKKSTAKSKKSGTRKSRRATGSGITAKQIFGGLSLGLGSVMFVAILFFIFSGGFQLKRAGGLVVPFAMIGMGWAWIKGETYGA